MKELRTTPSNFVSKAVIQELLAQANARPVKQVVAEVMAQWSDNSSDPDWSSEDDSSTSQRRRQRLRNGSPSLSEDSSEEISSTATAPTPPLQSIRRSLRQLERRRQAEQQAAASLYPTISDLPPAPQRPLRSKRRLQLRRKPQDQSNYTAFERVQLCRGRALPNEQEHCQSRFEDSLQDRQDEIRQRIIRSIDHAERVGLQNLACLLAFLLQEQNKKKKSYKSRRWEVLQVNGNLLKNLTVGVGEKGVG